MTQFSHFHWICFTVELCWLELAGACAKSLTLVVQAMGYYACIGRFFHHCMMGDNYGDSCLLFVHTAILKRNLLQKGKNLLL